MQAVQALGVYSLRASPFRRSGAQSLADLISEIERLGGQLCREVQRTCYTRVLQALWTACFKRSWSGGRAQIDVHTWQVVLAALLAYEPPDLWPVSFGASLSRSEACCHEAHNCIKGSSLEPMYLFEI